MEKINHSEIFEIFQDVFSKLTGLNIAFIDTNADFIKRAGDSRGFCILIGSIERKTGVSNCWISNYRACKRVISEQKPQVYKCHAGLTEIIVPVLDHGKAIGAIITGQIRTKGRSRYQPVSIPIGFRVTQNQLRSEFSKVQEMLPSQVRAAARTLYLLANVSFRDELVLFLSQGRKHRSSNMKNIILKATNFIRENFKDPEISLKRVADEVSLNSYYLSHIFKKELKSTFVNYLTRIRMEDTLRQLKHQPDKSIKEIAYESGYSDPYYFSKVFKKFYHSSPLKYRLKNA
ncbi:MAG: PocR ligand-binding domain-containing protein [Elusimicrobiota bacterium]